MDVKHRLQRDTEEDAGRLDCSVHDCLEGTNFVLPTI